MSKDMILVEGARYLKHRDTGAIHVWHEEMAKHDDLLEFYHHKEGDKFVPKKPRQRLQGTVSLSMLEGATA